MSGATSSVSAPAAKPASKMPEGLEVMLRAKGRGLHGFPLMGGWMVDEDTLTKKYLGLNAKEKPCMCQIYPQWRVDLTSIKNPIREL